MSVIVAIDQGTTSSRAIVFDAHGRALRVAQREFKQHYPRPGWVEHDPDEIWAAQLAVLAEAAAAPECQGGIRAIGITNQRETALLWDRATGEPVCRAIVWQDRRTSKRCTELRSRGHAERIRSLTGLEIDAYFSASKLEWMLNNTPGARDRAGKGELCFGTVDAWLVYKLTSGAVHATDPTNAGRTMLFDINTMAWSDELLGLFAVPREVLPTLVPSSGVIAEAAIDPVKGVPIAGIAGDQQAAMFGQACFEPGLVKNTYGTGCFALMHTGGEPKPSNNRLVATPLAVPPDTAPEYALEASVFVGGAVVQWLRDGLGLINESAEVEALAATVEDNGGVYLVPAFSGLGAPYWDQDARGLICGLTRGSTAGHIARAAIESIAFQVADAVDAISSDAGRRLPELRVDGGASANETLMQFQADLLGVPVVRPAEVETTAWGAACLAGLGVGLWKGRKTLASQWKVDRRFEPQMSEAERAERREAWFCAVRRTGSDITTGNF